MGCKILLNVLILLWISAHRIYPPPPSPLKEMTKTSLVLNLLKTHLFKNNVLVKITI
jgi:hypothetical protein